MTARALAITYAGLTVGAGQGDSNYTLTGVYAFTENYRQASVSFDVAINAASRASFLTSEAALVAAFTTIDSLLEVVLSGADRHSYDPDPTVNTGFNHRPAIEKQPEMATDRSAIYTCSVTCDLPADRTGRGGRLDSSVDVHVNAQGKKLVTISGAYTALSNVAARAQWAAQIDAYALAILDAEIGADLWELIDTPTSESDDQNKLVRFTRVYREIKHDQATGERNLAAVVDPSLVIRRSIPQVNSAVFLEAVPLDVVTVSYHARVRWAETTDLDDLWENTLRNYCLEEVQNVIGVSVLAVTEENWDFDPTENVISAELVCVSTGGANFWAAHVEWSENQNNGIVLKPVWDGNPYSRDTYQGMSSHTISIAYVTTGPTEGTTPRSDVNIEPSRPARQAKHPAAPKIENFVFVRESRRVRETSIGIRGNEIPIFVATTSYFYVRAEVAGTSPSAVGTRERGSGFGPTITSGGA